jgi:uncharacterized OB-fold protein
MPVEPEPNRALIPRPAPAPDQFVPSGAFWDGARAGVLMLQACGETGRFQHPPRPVSLMTGRRNVVWRAVCGRGTIHSWTVLRTQPAGPAPAGEAIVANIELEEGVRIIARLVDADPATISIGQKVMLDWDHFQDGTPYPAFRAADRGEPA